MAMGRPLPPDEIVEAHNDLFVPAPELAEWAVAAFIDPMSDIANPDHDHLRFAEIAFLWTNVENVRQGRRIVGQCELGEPQGAMGRWAKARARAQIYAWFGSVPDFVITIDARRAAVMTDAEFCALVEHELYHAGQERDAFGNPKFRQSGLPAYAMRGHDVEEFIGVVRRYGAGAAGIAELAEAMKGRPTIAEAAIAGVCGTCLGRAA